MTEKELSMTPIARHAAAPRRGQTAALVAVWAVLSLALGAAWALGLGTVTL